MDFSLLDYLAVLILGVFAGVINILAGGGSNLILPLLMVFGIDPQTANGTNRVGIWLQSIAGIRGFAHSGNLPTQDLPGILWPTLIGGLIGAVLAAKLDALLAIFQITAGLNKELLIKLILLGTMVAVAALMVFRPSTVLPGESDVRRVSETPAARRWLLLAGIYGGFVQAGVGFVLF